MGQKITTEKVLIYGVANADIRKRTELCISEGFTIIGYSDSYYDEDVLQGEKFIPVYQIKDYAIDYICVCVHSSDSFCQIKNMLRDNGFKGIILNVQKYFDSVPLYTPNLREELYHKEWKDNDSFKGVILGLSYSLRGIDCGKLEGDFYDFSWHGLDLYYNSILYDDAMQQWGQPYIDICLMVIPYYYFDYDMSISEYQYRTGQIYSVREYGWYNGNNFSESIQEYITCDNLFADKIFRSCKGKKYYQRTDYGRVKEEPLDKIWYGNYESTVEENKCILKEIIQNRGGRSVVIVHPFYLKNLSAYEREILCKKRDKFYGILDEFNKSVFLYDCIELYNDSALFADNWHLNHAGRALFTEYINEKVL